VIPASGASTGANAEASVAPVTVRTVRRSPGRDGVDRVGHTI